MKNISGRLTDLRFQLRKKKLAGFVVPSTDEFQSEYCPPHARRLEWLTGFAGSNGVAVVLEDKAAFFTDGRYTLQAQTEVDQRNFFIFDLAAKRPWEWVAENLERGKLGLDPWLHSESNAKSYMDVAEVELLKKNPIDGIWGDRPPAPDSEVKEHPLPFTGQKYTDKIAMLAGKIQQKKADACILAAPDSVCWLLNIRGNDIPTTPFVLAYAIAYKDGGVKLFIQDGRVSPKIREYFGGAVQVCSPSSLEKEIKALNNKTVLLDPAVTPYWFSGHLKKAKVVHCPDPCQLPKACKNSTEVEGARQAHIKDGVAVTRFLHWFATDHGKSKLTEVSVARKLLNFRREEKSFRSPSFDTIAGFAGNGAIVHYRPCDETDQEIKGNHLLLLDSGGQYDQGTTDITRTIAVGSPSDEHKQQFTRVLKGHIALARAVFPAGTTGTQLDVLARQFLWEHGQDYDHGTGHGVGSFLSVHEGPQRVSKVSSNVPLQPGMILSNEPGYYKEGAYGIRIESLVVVVECPDLDSDGRKFYGFDTLTRAPIDKKLIDKSLLTKDEQAWLTEYHKKVEKDLLPLLDKEVAGWLKKAV